MKTILIALTLSLLPLPALAQSWMMTGSLTDGSTVHVDSGSVKRSWRKQEQVSYRAKIESFTAGTTTLRMSGNCNTGSWRVTSGRSTFLDQGEGGIVSVPQAVGAQTLQTACSLPYNLTQPRTR